MRFEPARNIAQERPVDYFLDMLGLELSSQQVFFVAVAVAALILLGFLPISIRGKGRTKWFGATRPVAAGRKPRLVWPQRDDVTDPANQMHAIARVGFERARLLNHEESKLLPLLESVARKAGKGHRVMAQTSLGEILRPTAGSGSALELKAAFASINSKRLDFAVFDKSGLLVCAIEYQGSGHYQGNAFMRDAVKREALRRAGVPLIEVACGFIATEVDRAVMRILAPDRDGLQHRHTAVHM